MATSPSLRDELRAAFSWLGDKGDRNGYADVTGWWRDPAVLRQLGPALAEPFRAARPTLVLGPESRGVLLGALVATELGVGLVEVRKGSERMADSDAWLEATTPPDYRDRHLSMAIRRRLVSPGDRVLVVDDWIDTGGQVLGVRELVQLAGASWLGVSVIVDALDEPRLRRELGVRALLHHREL